MHTIELADADVPELALVAQVPDVASGTVQECCGSFDGDPLITSRIVIAEQQIRVNRES